MGEIKIGDKCLITTDDWFVAPDGRQYRSVFGTIKDVINAETALGIKTNQKSTNWYVEIGNMIIAGCQIHYIIKASYAHIDYVDDCAWSAKEGCKEFTRPTIIYNSDVEGEDD